MKPQSAKAKGRNLQKWVVSKLREKFGWHEDECTSRSMGAGGEDILLSPGARRAFPFSVECKNTERVNVYDCYEQAAANAGEYNAIVVYKRNRRQPLVIIDFNDFMELI